MELRRIYPVPELLLGGVWTIRHLARGGHTVPSKRLLAAPLVDTPFARAVRAHELSHVKYSPAQTNPKRLGVQADTLLAVEDARVNHLACRAGLWDVFRHLDDPAAGHVDPRDDFRAATLLLVAAHGTGARRRLWETYGDYGAAGARARLLAARAVAIITEASAPPTFRHTIKAARLLERFLGASDGAPLPFLCGGVREEGSLRRRLAYDGGGGDVPWGELRGIDEPVRPMRALAGLWARRSSDEGSLLRAPHRVLIDGRVFARRRRLPGGSLLIDGSGSMGLDRAAIDALLAVAPGALVARYDGTEDWGRIRILARGGWRVKDEVLAARCCGKGNVIDGPALRWLARQPGPRVWVTDGGVTGVGDQGSERLQDEAKQLCARFEIVVAEDAAAARRALAPRAAGGVVAVG